MNLVKTKCAFCNKEFFRGKGRFNEAKKFNWKQYCSPKCLARYRTKKQALFCENCGKCFERSPHEISPHNYCSSSCAAIVNNKKSPKIKPQFKDCLGCGKQFKKGTGNLKYCSMKCKVGAESKHTCQELISTIRQTTEELQRIPARREMKESKICQKLFGSWNNAISTAGLEPNRSHSQRMYKRTRTRALDGHICDSVSEAIIDNWLTENNLCHERDVLYPRTNHKADWAILVGKRKIFVEYFGLANDSPRYDRTIQQKTELAREYKLKLIGIYPKDLYPKIALEKKFGQYLYIRVSESRDARPD